jgi:hypothetical protein
MKPHALNNEKLAQRVASTLDFSGNNASSLDNPNCLMFLETFRVHHNVSPMKTRNGSEERSEQLSFARTCLHKSLTEVSVVALLLGAGPSLHFLPSSLRKAQRPEPYLPRTRTDTWSHFTMHFLSRTADSLRFFLFFLIFQPLSYVRTGRVLGYSIRPKSLHDLSDPC